MCCDVIETVFWQCDENDCSAPGGWHKASYWIDGRGYTVDQYSDGDHKKISRREIPKPEEAEQSRRDYAEWVVENGTDPLSGYIVEHTRKVRERWSIKVRRSILGLVVSEMKRGRARVPTRRSSIPKHLAECLNLKDTRTVSVLGDFETLEQLAAAGIKLDRWHTFTVERRVDRPAHLIAADLRKIARRHLLVPKLGR